MAEQNFRDLNAKLNLWDAEGKVQFDSDKDAVRDYFTNEDEGVNANTVFFHSIEEKADYLIENGHWDEFVALRYGIDGLKSLMKYAYSFKFRFQTFLGAYKFYTQYALKTNNGERFLERFEDRVVMTAIAHSDSYEHAERLVKHIIEGRFQPATPTFLNAGRVAAGEPTSCYLLRIDDSMESIARAQSDALQLSKRGGGVAFSLSNVREAGAPIKNVEGQSSGVVPIMKILEDSFSYANQLGARQGAGAVYLNAHHPDILAFLDTKRENADEKVRIKTLSIGVVIPDITFELLKSGEDMLLFSPYDIKKHYNMDYTDFSMTQYYRTFENDERIGRTSISSRELMRRIAELQFESGYPYIMFEDTVNHFNPVPNVGRISQSNLCVAPETRLLTDQGYVVIEDVAGKYVNAWNGEKFSRSYVEKTGEGQELIQVQLSNGAKLDVTPAHKFYVKTGYGNARVEEVRAAELQTGDKLEKFNLPVVDVPAESLPMAYTAGLFTSEGTYASGRPVLRLYGEKKNLVEYIDYRSSSLNEDSSGRISLRLHDHIARKFSVPIDYSLSSRLEWLAGVIDGDGYGNGAVGIQIASVNPEYLEEMRVLLTTLGVHSKWSKHKEAGFTDFGDGYGPYPTKEIYRLVISGYESQKLRRLGLPTKRVVIEPYEHQRAATEFVKVTSVVAHGRVSDTYCLNEPELHKVVFEGVRTGNCSEILQPQTPSVFNSAGEFVEPGRDIACNLGSLNVSKMSDADPELFATTVNDAVRFLSNVATNADFSCSPSVKEGNASARAIGLGQMNLHGHLIKRGIPYDSEEAVDFWRDYIQKVTYFAIKASTEISWEHQNPFYGFEGSDWQNGNVIERIIEDCKKHGSKFFSEDDWRNLQEEIERCGMFNQHLQAIPPTGSISYINNSTSSIHPITSKIEIRKEGKVGRVYYPAFGLDNDNFSDVKTAYEIGPNPIIDMYAASTPYIDQGQSLTLFFTADATTRDLNRAHNYAHKAGVKTLYYVRLQQSAITGTKVDECVSCML